MATDWIELTAAIERLGLRVVEVDKKAGIIVARIPPSLLTDKRRMRQESSFPSPDSSTKLKAS